MVIRIGIQYGRNLIPLEMSCLYIFKRFKTFGRMMIEIAFDIFPQGLYYIR